MHADKSFRKAEPVQQKFGALHWQHKLTLKFPSRMPYGPSSEAVSNNMVAFLFYQQPLNTLPNKLLSYAAVLPPIQTQAVPHLFGTSSRFFLRSIRHLRSAYPPS